MIDNNRLKYLQIIESEEILNNRYKSIKRMGKNGGNGAFSLMFTANDIKTGNKIALKFFDPSKFNDSDRYKRFEREAEMLVILKGEPMVIDTIDEGLCFLEKKLVDANTGLEFPSTPLPYITLELAECSLEDIVYSKEQDAITKLYLFRELTKAVFRIHSRCICHRDLKPSNFLIFSNKLCLSDFGTAKCMDDTMPDIRAVYQEPVGDLRYLAPEVLSAIGIADQFVYTSDIFSLGAILFEMFTKNILTLQMYNQKLVERLLTIKNTLVDFPLQKRTEVYDSMIKEIEKSVTIPDIDSYNDEIPSCIRLHLNELYMNLTKINYNKRLYRNQSIFRKIDICILILKNELMYKKWKEEKRKRREIRLKKLKIRNRNKDYDN